MKIKVTVCELLNDEGALSQAWKGLKKHLGRKTSDLVLLPEMPFFPWFPSKRDYDAQTWAEAVRARNTYPRYVKETMEVMD